MFPIIGLGWRKIKDWEIPFSKKSDWKALVLLFGSLLIVRATEAYAMYQIVPTNEIMFEYMKLLTVNFLLFIFVFPYIFFVNWLNEKYLNLIEKQKNKIAEDVFVERP